MMATSFVVCSFCFIISMEYKILLQIKYYNCVRDKTKDYVFGLGVVFDYLDM